MLQYKPAPLPGQAARAAAALGPGWQVLDQGEVLRCTHAVTSVWFLVSSASPFAPSAWAGLAKAVSAFASTLEAGQGGQVELVPSTTWEQGRPSTTWSCRSLARV